mgnify:CR=1 FL=1
MAYLTTCYHCASTDGVEAHPTWAGETICEACLGRWCEMCDRPSEAPLPYSDGICGDCWRESFLPGGIHYLAPEELMALRAGAIGDQALTCDRALAGDPDAIMACLAVIQDAQEG